MNQYGGCGYPTSTSPALGFAFPHLFYSKLHSLVPNILLKKTENRLEIGVYFIF
jgi:hypothetical protein